MTTYYVDSDAGSATAPYDTWAKAATSLATIAAIDAAGDIIYVASTHAESTAGAVSWAWAGTLASPTRIICADKTSGEPPITAATGGSATTTGNNNLTVVAFAGSYVYIYGLTFISGSGASGTASIINVSQGVVVFDNCRFTIGTTGTGSRIELSNIGAEYVRAKNCTFKFGATAQALTLGGGCTTEIIGGGIDATSSAITLFAGLASGDNLWISGFNFAAAASTLSVTNSTNDTVYISVRDCKMPASWSGSVSSSTPGDGTRFVLNNSDSTDTNYRIIDQQQFGTVTSETTIVQSGGASDGVTALSWRVVSNANPEYPFQPVVSPEIVKKYTGTVPATVTATIQFVHDSATALQDNQIWMGAMYMGTSGFPLGSWTFDDVEGSNAGNLLAAAANQTTSTFSWVTTGLSNPNKQQVSVPLVIEEKGYVHALVYFAKATSTVFISPLILGW